MDKSSCAILFSGGTDSTCAAGLCAERFDQVHLLTFFETATSHSPVPAENVRRLREKYGEDKFVHHVFSTDRLVQKLSFEHYFSQILKHGFFVLSTPGLSSLSWHMRAIWYARENGIRFVFDGMTRELTHLPGHMPRIREMFQELYAKFGIEFSSPVIHWDIPADQRFVGRLIVDRHGFTSEPEKTVKRTTGTWLFEKGIFPHANVKGSLFDHRMQHDCYPFIVYNIFVFWFALAVMSWESFENKLSRFFADKVTIAERWLESAARNEPWALALFEGGQT